MNGPLASGPQPSALNPVFTWPVRVYWEDTDAGGIVFYANYLKYFERARTEWLRSLGLQQHTLKAQLGGMFVVTEAQLRYHLPARLDDLPLFAAVAEPPPAPISSVLDDAMAGIDPDELTPREALEALYRLKGLSRS